MRRLFLLALLALTLVGQSFAHPDHYPSEFSPKFKEAREKLRIQLLALSRAESEKDSQKTDISVLNRIASQALQDLSAVEFATRSFLASRSGEDQEAATGFLDEMMGELKFRFGEASTYAEKSPDPKVRRLASETCDAIRTVHDTCMKVYRMLLDRPVLPHGSKK